MSILSRKKRFKNIARKPPERRTKAEDGTIVTEKLCSIPLNYKAVGPSGEVIQVALDNGVNATDIADSPYGMRIWRDKQRRGFIRYKDCPVLSKDMAAPKNFKGCEGGSDTQCCEHMTQLIENRKARQTEKAAEFAENFKRGEEKMLEAMMATAKAIHASTSGAGAKSPFGKE